MFKHFRLIAAIAAVVVPLTGMPLPAHAANAFGQVRASLALVGAVGKDGTLDSLGTAFSISSDGTNTYFVTNNHVVTDDDGKPETALIAILARDMNDPHPQRYNATIVRRSEDPDLAVVAVQVTGIPPVHIAQSLPDVGDDIAIAGFPYNESVIWGALFGGKAFRMDRAFPPELTPSEHKGSVSALHGNGYYIQYDALTDSGNSGGPLFNPQTGDVYGVVQASVEGSREYRGVPSPIHNNLAISIAEGWKFIAQAPVQVPGVTIASAPQRFAGVNARCERARAQAGHTRAAMAAITQKLSDPHYAAKRGAMQRALHAYARALAHQQRAARSCA